MRLAIALTCLLLVGFARGQIPTEDQCLSAFERVGLDELQSSLTPCAFSASSTCCNNIDNLVALDADSEFAGCLCNQGVIDLMIEEIESNSLAQSIGFDGDRLMDVLETCNAPFAGTPVCTTTPPPPPASVSVDVETPAVSVSVGTTRVPSPPPPAPVEIPEEPEVIETPEEPEVDVPELPQEPKTDTRGSRVEVIKEMVSKPEIKKPSILRKKKGLGLKEHKEKLVSGMKDRLTPEPKDSSTFEDARKKIDVIKKNLSGTRDTISNSMLDGKKKVLDMKAGTPSSIVDGMIVEPKATGPSVGTKDEMVVLIPVEVDAI